MLLHEAKKFDWRSSLPWLVFVVATLTIGYLLSSVNLEPRPKDQGPFLVSCDMETTEKDANNQLVFVSAGATFTNGHTQKSLPARSGDQVSFVNEAQPYGLHYALEGALVFETYRIRVWRKGEDANLASLVFSMPTTAQAYYLETNKIRKTDAAGWQLLELNMRIPSNYTGGPIGIFVYSKGGAIASFDDFSIERVTDQFEAEEKDSLSSIGKLQLDLSDTGTRKIEQKRKQALDRSFLITEDDDWVKGKLTDATQTYDIKARLKGDHVDHLRQDKWSFRIKIKDGNSWNGLLTFSLQSPEARSFLHEWVLHQMMEAEDILTTRYDFVEFSLNGKDRGVYAYEEHFEKQLVESRNRREGPILKFDETHMWESTLRQRDQGVNRIQMPSEQYTFEAAEITPFREKKTYEDSSLSAQFLVARDLMYQYKWANAQPAEIFDLEKMAMYVALLDLNEAYHNLVWHNQRFYYNPITQKLEPIAFDGFTEGGPFNPNGLVMAGANLKKLSPIPQENLVRRLFQDAEFIRHYLTALQKISAESYLEAFMAVHDEGMRKRLHLLREEFPEYVFQPERLFNRARIIREVMRPLPDNAVRAYQEKTSSDSMRVSLMGFHRIPLEILGFGRGNAEASYLLKDPLYLPAYIEASMPSEVELNIPVGYRYVFFRLPGQPETFTSQISNWPSPLASFKKGPSHKRLSLPAPPVCVVQEKVIQFQPGSFSIDQDILIPAGYTVEFLARHQLNLIKGAKFVSYSPVRMWGSAERPIRIWSADHQGQGFTVLQPQGENILQHVEFEGLNTIQEADWKLTGAVTFYEAEVKMEQCRFLDARCEDGLNLVRCTFELEDLLVEKTFSDGLDIDFGQGKIQGMTFRNTGNDGLDFSGSQIELKDIFVYDAGDKGMSVGENSQVRVENLTVTGAPLGVAAKDLSHLHVESLVLKNCRTGITAFRKKPEFGPASIFIRQLAHKQVNILQRIEKGSKLTIQNSQLP